MSSVDSGPFPTALATGASGCDHRLVLRATHGPATKRTAATGLADARTYARRGGRIGGKLGIGEELGAGPARVWHARSAWASTVPVPYPDRPALPDLRHDHGLRLVCAWRLQASLE